MSNKKNNDEYQASLKSMDTEEWFDLHFYRPIGYMWAKLGRRLGITPNAITVASIFLGIGAGVCFYFNNIWWNLLGVVLLVWADSFDSADGQLARMTGQYSRIGRILDGVSGDLWFAAIYAAICLRENVTSEFFMAHHWVIWVMAAVTGICPWHPGRHGRLLPSVPPVFRQGAGRVGTGWFRESETQVPRDEMEPRAVGQAGAAVLHQLHRGAGVAHAVDASGCAGNCTASTATRFLPGNSASDSAGPRCR